MITRLHGRDRFRQLHRQGTRVRAGSLWCVMLFDPMKPDTEVAYAIGRTTGSAVQRNRLRRRLRALLAQRDHRLPTGVLLIGVRTGHGGHVASRSFAQLAGDVDRLIEQLNTQRDHHTTVGAVAVGSAAE